MPSGSFRVTETTGYWTMRDISSWIAAIAGALVVLVPQQSEANLISLPREARWPTMQHISLDTPTLAPMAFTMFCLRYADQCRPLVSRGKPVRLTDTRMEELRQVNDRVNASILPERNDEGLAVQKWLIAPTSGDCNDYAVTKRAELLHRGWPARALLLSEVVTSLGEHHLVLVVRTKSSDLVLDNLTDTVRLWSTAEYQWVRMQTPANPNYWATVADRRDDTMDWSNRHMDGALEASGSRR
jgi:predicted transglutaminase-like cysteine proteinase